MTSKLDLILQFFHFPLLQQGHVVVKFDESLFLVNVITESLQTVDLKFLFSIPEFLWFLANVVACELLH